MVIKSLFTRGTYIHIGEVQGRLYCSLVVNGEILYLAPPNWKVSRPSIVLAAAEIALKMNSLNLGSNRRLFNGTYFNGELSEGESPCGQIDIGLVMVFNEKLTKMLPLPVIAEAV